MEGEGDNQRWGKGGGGMGQTDGEVDEEGRKEGWVEAEGWC